MRSGRPVADNWLEERYIGASTGAGNQSQMGLGVCRELGALGQTQQTCIMMFQVGISKKPVTGEAVVWWGDCGG
jgi:hypothetical protein